MGTDLNIICHACLAVNRVPQNRMQDAPKCGKCHKALFSAVPLELTDHTLQKVLNGSSQPLLVLFWAPWCGYCQKTLPDFKQAITKLQPEIRLATLNTENNRLSASRYTVNSLPTFILFKGGKEIARQAGAMSAVQIMGWVQTKNIP